MDLISTNIFIIRISLYVGFFFLASSTILFTMIFLNRLRIIRKHKKEEDFTNKWRPILLENLYKVPKSLEPVPAKYNIAFLILWNNLQDVLKGKEKEHLNQLARSLKMDQVALKLIKSRKMVNQILGILVLGNLVEKNAFDKLKNISEKNNITLSMTALHSMAKINPEKTINPLLSFIKERSEWPSYKVVMILDEIGPSVFSKPLADLIKRTKSKEQPPLIRLMKFADPEIAKELAEELLDSAFDPEVISASLEILEKFGDPRNIKTIEKHVNSDLSFLRMRAVKALASLGSIEILPILEKSLTDPDWWVRYRTAEALVSLPMITRDDILKIRDRQNDKFATDILNYVLF
jgi:hypothetical protein